MQERFIDTPRALQQLVERLAQAPWLAVDTEFMRERSYYPELCLIQVASDQVAACIDPLALEDLAPLRDLLTDPGIIKVFHAGRQDLELFLALWQILPRPVFDTQPAAALLGLGDQVGYGTLVQKLLGVNLAKDHSRTDWSHRPLEPDQLRYALDDVIYLGRLYPELRRRLEALGRLEWLVPEFAWLTDPQTYAQDPMDQWKRVKGRRHLHGVRLAVLQELAAWREYEAMARNLPRRWVLKDDLLVELARRAPTTSARLRRVRGMDEKRLSRYGTALLEAIRRGQARPREEWPQESDRPAPSDPVREATLDLLGGALRLLAAEADLSPQAIGGRKELAALVDGDPHAALRRGWRLKVAGEPLMELLEGRARLDFQHRRARLIRP